MSSIFTEQQCDDIVNVIGDEKLLYTCTSFGVGGVCELSCDAGYVISGLQVVACKWSDVVQSAYWDWQETACIG